MPIEEMTFDDLKKLINKYQHALGGIEQLVIFIKPEIYEKLKDEIEFNWFSKIIKTEIMPDDQTFAVVMTKTQYDNYYGMWEDNND